MLYVASKLKVYAFSSIENPILGWCAAPTKRWYVSLPINLDLDSEIRDDVFMILLLHNFCYNISNAALLYAD
jgi:hypothetical protein